ncbi:inosine/xanthosine triphosphatase [Lentibacillus persicus]|uniref:inosine/xanthosine triphosphatase n=1 Tax=Lentibacillus persicus TaxID=640948 RepID=A0A1I1TSW5_9BACI|nr:DUF84 family protein [Lentibacillus persicus]SFD61786.1 inosine/xanthosine triphosphatase [Lentibacillus persicus]
MRIVIGSGNPAKIAAVKAVFTKDEVSPADVPSLVRSQPFSDQETREGAINRAAGSLKTVPADLSIGLEGGVMYVGEDLYLCNWGSLITRENTRFTAAGARVLLPKEIEQELLKGVELGDIMDGYAKRKNVRKKEGAIGIFTNDRISRQDMFTHVVKLLHGQWEYWQRT